MNKVPLLCRIKNKLVNKGLLYRSTSAIFNCKYGFQYNTYKCINCPMKQEIRFKRLNKE